MKNIFISFIIFNALFVSAKKYDMVNLTNNDGLSNSSINHIFQDSNGLMWFGTWDGLNVYNGREFKVFKPEPGIRKVLVIILFGILLRKTQISGGLLPIMASIEWICEERSLNVTLLTNNIPQSQVKIHF